MAEHEELWTELAALLRSLKDLNCQVLHTTGVRCELAGAAVLGRLDALGPVRLTELAAALGLDPSSVSRQVSALERSGWVAREEDPQDRRATRLLLTAAGRDVVATLQRARADALARLTPDWTSAELVGLTAQLARLNGDLSTQRLTDARLENA